MCQSKIGMTEQIFAATERLMEVSGLHCLSMHKIAKEANISVGTIYLYFKNKDELLEQFARRLFLFFCENLGKDYDDTLSYFEQYRRMWLNLWNLLNNNPKLLININQYHSLFMFYNVFEKEKNAKYWEQFCQRGIQENALCELPPKILFILGLETAINLALDKESLNQSLSDDMLERIIERSWRAIKK
ncbi:TetR family transcriptional regulator [Bisgaardia hudsonensis]|uniref:TetR family transcriptional regulator n=1 Tax=Bisgaardia hudsonensis TaxID=109472 RepID=A0A4R2N002_9PAST|nr:TetR/AcrR family transcriptional regulator [Bisgaardia hudsonensis]QLB12289.1 TetR family transcriptional regulator [Bisgaardia hudsonensis]TCP12333.1 TetR family transcriptional regulator [Bisgaardia hudsonensis]